VSKIFPYFTLGWLTSANLTLAGALLPIALVGLFIGIKVQRRLSQEWFMRICYTLLLLVGCQLLYEGLKNI